MIIVFAALAFLSTFVGGLAGFRYRDKLHLILGFTAGVLLGVVALDIFPEIIELVGKLHTPVLHPMIALVVGFLLFHILETLFAVHAVHEASYGEHRHPAVGVMSALALVGHSFFDGISIGLGFQVSPMIGITVAVAVIAHDFSDGLNTVSLMLLNKNTTRKALVLLFADAAAPVLGATSTFLFQVPDGLLVLYLGFFAGFLLYIGAANILPEAHHSHHSPVPTMAMTVLGVLFIFVVTRLV